MVYLELICPHCGRISPFSPMDELWEQWCIRCGTRFEQPPGTEPVAEVSEEPAAPAVPQRIPPLRPNPDKAKPLQAALSSWAAATATAVPEEMAPQAEASLRTERRMGSDGVSRDLPIQQTPEPGEVKPAGGAPGSHAWLMGSALIVLGMAGSAYLGFHLAGVAERSSAPPEVRGTEPEFPATAAKRMAERFLAAATPEELLACLRDAPAREQSVRDWCAKNPGRLPLGGRVTAQQFPRQVLGRRILESNVEYADGSRSLLLSVESPAGWLIDWMSFTAAGDMTVADFLVARPEQPVLLLVMAQRGDYYNGPYADSAVHECLRLTDERATQIFYGYLPRSGEVAAALPGKTPAFDATKPPPQPRQPLAVRARFAPGAKGEPAQVEITGIAGEGWFVP